ASGTGAAWLAELYGPNARSQATITTIAANFSGLGVVPLLAGGLAAYAPFPLELPFIAYLVALCLVGGLLARFAPETVVKRPQDSHAPTWRPRIAVPKRIRGHFIAPATTIFASFALGGFYFALLPSVVSQALHGNGVAIGGAVVFELTIATVVCVAVTRKLETQVAMFAGLVSLIPGAGLLVLAEALKSMPLMLVAAAVTGCAIGLGYRGSLQAINAIAPAERRAEVVSAYFIAGFVGNSLPVIGMGVVSSLSTTLTASITLAVTVVVFALFALVAGRRYSVAEFREQRAA
ncbi:MAG: MFS transporter, partial [Candidatus Eremiobacteraeota bacterium]|nr:MFS transporter [Candidatus Eremiobacteraeota bacterium]